MVAGELINSPKVAITLDNRTRRKKSKSGDESSRSRTWTSFLLFWLTGGTIRRHKYRKATRIELFFVGGSFILIILPHKAGIYVIDKVKECFKRDEIIKPLNEYKSNC